MEYAWFALGIVACLGLIFAALTNCQWAAGFFTLLLAVLAVLFGVMALLLFALASIGNDACAPPSPGPPSHSHARAACLQCPTDMTACQRAAAIAPLTPCMHGLLTLLTFMPAAWRQR